MPKHRALFRVGPEGACRPGPRPPARLGETELLLEPPGDPSDYEGWPAPFRAFVGQTNSLSLNDGEVVIGEDADGGLDNLKNLLKGTSFESHEAEVHCPVEQIPDSRTTPTPWCSPTREDYVVVSSSKGISFLRVFDDGKLALNKTPKREFPKQVSFSGGLMLVNNPSTSRRPWRRASAWSCAR